MRLRFLVEPGAGFSVPKFMMRTAPDTAVLVSLLNAHKMRHLAYHPAHRWRILQDNRPSSPGKPETL